jgi:O-antigen ligase
LKIASASKATSALLQLALDTQHVFNATHPGRQASLRQLLALVRLSLLFGQFCFLLLSIGLAVRGWREAGGGLNNPLPDPASPAMQIPFLGINTQLERSDPIERRRRLAGLHQLGFGWVRQRLDWGPLEPQPGQFNWQLSDALLADLSASSLIPVIVLDGSPPWARDLRDRDNPLAPPADPATFARFAAAFATRYGQQLRFYQIWDEPNIAPHWGERLIEPLGYAQLLKAAAAAIRQADPDVVILTAALAPTADRGHTAMDEVYFLQRLYAAGAAPHFDAVAVQPFGFGSSPHDGRARTDVLNFQRLKLVRRAMVAAGDGATPLWAVRYGWNHQPASPWATVIPAVQTQFAVAALDMATTQWPWLATMGWAIDQPDAPSTDPAWGFALTPALAKVFREWQAPTPSRRSPTSPKAYWLPALLLNVAGLLILWRGVAAARLLPWAVWSLHYRRWPLIVQLGLWLLLITLYHLATWPPLILLCWLGAALLIAAKPRLGLVLATVVIPFYFQHKEIRWVDTPITLPPAHAALLALLPTLLWHAYQQRQRVMPRFSLLDGCALLWLLLSLASTVNVWHWPAYSRGLAEAVLAPLILYWAARMLAQGPDQRRMIAVALLISGGFVTLLGLIGWLQGEGTVVDDVQRLVGPYYSANHAALYLVRTLFLGIGLALTAHGRWRQGWVAATALVGLALLLTASRGALLLGIPMGAVVFAWTGRAVFLRWGRGRRLGRAWSFSLLGSSLFLGLIALPLIGPRLGNSATLLSRFQIWQNTLQLWQDFPWLGVGPGGFFWRYPAMLTHPLHEPNILHPHNLWLEIGATWGIFGIVWFVLLLTLVWRLRPCPAQAPASHWLAIGLLAGWAAGLAHAQVDAFWILPDLALWNWLALGLLANMKDEANRGAAMENQGECSNSVVRSA